MEGVERIPIDPKLNLETYLLLKQRAGRLGISMSQYVIDAISKYTFRNYEIATHNLVPITEDMDALVQRASGYYLTMIRQGKISEDLCKHILSSYQRIDETISSYYKSLFLSRDKAVKEEEQKLTDIIASSQKNTPPDKSISADREKNGFLKIWLPPEVHEKLIHDMEVAGYKAEEKTRYISDIVNAKRFIFLTYYIEDIRYLNQIIYKATKPYPSFVRVLSMQGEPFKDALTVMQDRCAHIQEIQKEIWHIVMNDRKGLYQKSLKKIKQSNPKRKGYERRRSLSEKGV